MSTRAAVLADVARRRTPRSGSSGRLRCLNPRRRHRSATVAPAVRGETAEDSGGNRTVSGVVVRVARMGKSLTFVDVAASERLVEDDSASDRVYAKVTDGRVDRKVRPGATVEFEWTWQTEAQAERRPGAYVEAREVRVLKAAPVSAVANATKEMLNEYANARGRVGLIDVRSKKGEKGRTMSAFGICKAVLGGDVCVDPNCAKRHDVTDDELRSARASREKARERSRAAMAAERSSDDPHGEANKESKAVSDRLFAKWCMETFKLNERRQDGSFKVVGDIAGGSGTLSFEFHVNHGVGCVLVDPRCVSLTPRQRANWSNLRRRGARADAKLEAKDAWLRSELWVRCADEQREKRLEQHVQRLVAYTEAGSEEDVDDVIAGAPPKSDEDLTRLEFDEFPVQIPSTVASMGGDIAPFTHIRSELWSLDDSSVGQRLKMLRPSLLVGMHPDQATEAIIDAALELGVPFAVVPCCTFPEMFPHRKTADGEPVATYSQLIDYLMRKDPSIQKTFLPFKGRNQVLYRTL